MNRNLYTHRPSGRRSRVMELSPEQKASRRAPMTKAQDAYHNLMKSSDDLRAALEQFKHFDFVGIPEEWLPHLAVRLDAFLVNLLRFQCEINSVVASDPYLATIRQRQNLKRVKLHEDVTARSILEDALRLSEGASVEAVIVVRRMIHALDDAAVDGVGFQTFGEDEAGTCIVQNDITHAGKDSPATGIAQANDAPSSEVHS